jgi:hypothetical protein
MRRITESTSPTTTFCGQRAVQVWQIAQIHKSGFDKTSFRIPRRLIWMNFRGL